MLITTIKTHKIKPKESIFAILDKYLPKLKENSVVAISSKIISTCENHIIKKTKGKSKIINEQAEFCFDSPANYPDFFLTLKNHRLIPNAGIDESNCNNFYALLPQEPQLTSKKIWEYLRKKHHIKKLGIIITDSNITPLRSGVTGISIGWCGFKPIHSYIGQKDIFGHILKVSQINLLDSLATTATLATGEGNEQTPIAIIENPYKIKFQNRAPNKKEEKMICVSAKEDLFRIGLSL
ncbi:MAG: hypothetical protein ACD_69C00032G0003 [uncultured bacterium]|nr:MAG: hypothetical protein ACD_69C00032G0003 [uncultured bacterium]OGT09588.1 MAG: hypothetical protein A2V89_03755 [Gammaproteobacteria bacterium RBG_16_37_9]HBC71367.1 putative folate metabolism gamma-glutamate ligase [Coxiellaceae bacterium]HBS51392.1 putative folate metabolism gamma-glutamate ligase [Coxiellaceae bacterium]HBY55939.1 putative folate metabolism gamma-glutamate ligase [Coxiellaceae bacterium]